MYAARLQASTENQVRHSWNFKVEPISFSRKTPRHLWMLNNWNLKRSDSDSICFKESLVKNKASLILDL